MSNKLPLALLLGSGLAFATAAPTPARVSMAGYGEARIGMGVQALESAIGGTIAPAADEDEAACRFASSDKLPAGVGFMLLGDRLARIDVDEPGVATLSGAAVGDSQAAVIARYGAALEVTNHFYTGPQGKYLSLYSRDRKSGIRFETDGSRVTRYYAGTAEAVQYVEGCQ